VATLGEPVPPFELLDLEGRRHSSADYFGRILLSYFWSAHCSVTQRVDRTLISLKRGWPKAVIVLAIASNADETREEIRSEAQARQVETVLLDPGAQVADLFGAVVTPLFLLADPKGILRYRGALDDVTFRQPISHINYVDRAIGAVLAGKTPDPGETPGYGCALVRFSGES